MSDKYLDRAFPLGSGSTLDDQGMTLRDYFAAKAMQGLQANPHEEVMEWGFKDMTRYAYEMADAMMEARKT